MKLKIFPSSQIFIFQILLWAPAKPWPGICANRKWCCNSLKNKILPFLGEATRCCVDLGISSVCIYVLELSELFQRFPSTTKSKTHVGIIQRVVVAIVTRRSVFITPHSLRRRLSDVIISASVQLWRHLRLVWRLVLLILSRWLMCARRLHQKHLLIRTRHVVIVGMIRWM